MAASIIWDMMKMVTSSQGMLMHRSREQHRHHRAAPIQAAVRAQVRAVHPGLRGNADPLREMRPAGTGPEAGWLIREEHHRDRGKRKRRLRRRGKLPRGERDAKSAEWSRKQEERR